MNEKEMDEAALEDYSRLVNELISARRELSRLNAELRRKEAFLMDILQVAPSIIYAADTSSRKIIFANRSLSAELGYPPGDYNEKSGIPLNLVHPDDRDAVREFRSRGRSESVGELHFRVRRSDGSFVWYRAREKIAADESESDGKIVIGSLEEITGLKMRELALKTESMRDFLTGLLNRRGFLEAVENRLKKASQRSMLLFIDLDHFKHINDRYGHEAGDEALKAFAHILEGSLRADDIPARWGGDEFIAFLSDAGSEAFDIVHHRILERLEHFNRMHEYPWKLSISVGSSVYGENGVTSLHALIAEADARMYASRQHKGLQG